jgi:hypothetical protein
MGCHPSTTNQDVVVNSEKPTQPSTATSQPGHHTVNESISNDVSQRIQVEPNLNSITPRPPSQDGFEFSGVNGTPLDRTGSGLSRSDPNGNPPSLPTDHPNFSLLQNAASRCSLLSVNSGGSAMGGIAAGGNLHGSGSQEGGYSPGQPMSLPSWLIAQKIVRIGEMVDSQTDEGLAAPPSPLGAQGSPLTRLSQRSRCESGSRKTPSTNARSIFESASTRGMILQQMEEERAPAAADLGDKNPMEALVVSELSSVDQQYHAEGLAGSTSTTRFSLKSANSGSGSGTSTLQSVTGADSLPTPPKQVAFNSISIMAPRCGGDRVEVRRRLQGGYVDKGYALRVAGQSGQPWESGYYPTAAERRMAREQEFQNEARNRKGLCPGLGLLWNHPSVEGGIPYPLAVLEEKYQLLPPFTGNQEPWYADVRCRWRTLRFLLTVQQYLASLMRELTNPEALSARAVVVAVELVEEFVAASHHDSCPHIRIRILLTQLLVQLMDTLVLLEEPERFVQEFSKVNETELIDLLGDVSLSQQATSDDVQRDLGILVQTLKKRQSNILHYILLMIDNCIGSAVIEVRSHRSLEEKDVKK